MVAYPANLAVTNWGALSSGNTADLDTNFRNVVTALNGIGNGSSVLQSVAITTATLTNANTTTLISSNATITAETVTILTATNAGITTGNISNLFVPNATAASFGGNNPLTLQAKAQQFTGGVRSPGNFLGNSGVYTIDYGSGPIQLLTNNGNITLTASTFDGGADVWVTNVAGAGNITFSGGNWKIPPSAGDALSQANNSVFILSTRTGGNVSTLVVKALQ